MQIVGRPGAEAVVLAIAARVERRWPWQERRPRP
jgi:Asp-tRNA(Asn)/Glu-tRNA(Gln) amidotransferase A subunit family amidase